MNFYSNKRAQRGGLDWAFPEINGNPLKKTWDSQNVYSSFPVGIPKTNYPFYSRKCKEDMGIPNF